MNLEVHMVDFHKKSCPQCDYVTYEAIHIRTHIQTEHKAPKVDIRHQKLFRCSECNYACNLNIKLKKHIEKEHSFNKYQCENCSYRTDLIASLWEHSLASHPELITPFQTLPQKIFY